MFQPREVVIGSIDRSDEPAKSVVHHAIIEIHKVDLYLSPTVLALPLNALYVTASSK